MAVSVRSSRPTRLGDTFYCRSRRNTLTLERCLDGYLQANAMEVRRSACYRCPLGRCCRQNFADGWGADAVGDAAGN